MTKLTKWRMSVFVPLSIVALAVVAPAPARGAPRTAAAETAVESSAPAKGRAAFVGRWILDEDLSEDPRQKMQQAMQERRRGGGGGPGGWGGLGMPAGGRGGWPGGGGRGGGRGMGRGRPGEERTESRRPPLLSFFSAKDITIANVEPSVAIVEPDGLVRTLQPDGEKHDVEHAEGKVTARWMDDALDVETTSGRGTVKETWTVAPDTGQLTVLVEIGSRGPMSAVTVRRVFDRAPTTE
jgi:hypothetical protein